MKHIFVINPKSGKKDRSKEIIDYLEQNYKQLNYEVYITKEPNDASKFVQKKCQETTEEMKFYACGGDGTLNEVVNGMAEYKHASVTFCSYGSGNDFIKVFGKDCRFDIDSLIYGREILIDLLYVNGRYCVNMCNLGFDASVAYNMAKFKHWPLVSGNAAYNLGLIHSLLFSMKNVAKIYVDDEEVFNGKFLLTTSSNGICCGGSYYCTPNAVINDGLIDVVVIKKVARINFVGLVGKYKDGTYMNYEKYNKYITTYKAKKLRFVALKKDLIYGLDGESFRSKEVNIQIKEKKIRFVIPHECITY